MLTRRNGASAYRNKPFIIPAQVSKAPVPRKKKKKYKSQGILKELLESILSSRAVQEQKFSWLKSPRGGYLRLDIFFPELKIAFEYHGKQHAEFPNAFHKTAEDFRYAAMCDEWKRQACSQHNILVYSFDHKDKLTRQAVMYKLRKLGVNYGN
jgi:hypothetical protein